MKNVMNQSCVNYMCGHNQCRILDRKSCVGCSFYSTASNSNDRRKRASARLRSLPTNKQVAISEKYYGGVAIWANEKPAEASVQQ